MKKYSQLHDFYLGEGEKGIVDKLLPEFYIDKNIDENKVNVDFAVRFLQNELNNVLNSFLNGGFSYRGFLFYPLVKDVSTENKKRIERLKKIVIFLNNKGYDFSESIKKCNNYADSKDFALALSSMYQDFSLIKNKKISKIKKAKCKELDLSDYEKSDLEYLKPLNDLKKYANTDLKQYLSGFYLHGSLATKDYIKGWSDVDTLSIVAKKTIENANALLGLRDKLYLIRKFFFAIDPLQHHGSIIISEYDLENYCQPYFPLPVFKYAKSFLKNDRAISFRVRDFKSESIKRMLWFISYFRKIYIENKFNIGSYDLKILLHSITLFPAIYLQAKGILVYKKFSFGIAGKYFDRDDWLVIDNVSLIRSNWKSLGTIPFVRLCSGINPLLCYQLNSRVIDLFRNTFRQNNINVENIVKSMHRLSEEAWENIKKNELKI